MLLVDPEKNIGKKTTQKLWKKPYLQIMLSSAVLHILNWVFHCSTLTPELHSTIAYIGTGVLFSYKIMFSLSLGFFELNLGK